jgi:WD40 repeat protein
MTDQWVYSAAWSQDGLSLLACGGFESVVWDTSGDQLVRGASFPSGHGCAITKNGDRVALVLGNGKPGYEFARTSELSVFHAKTSAKLVTLQDDFEEATCCCFSADERSLAVAFSSKTVYGSGRVSLYDLTSGKPFAWFFLPNKANIARLVIASEVAQPSLIATDEDGHLFLLTLQQKADALSP